MKPRRPVMSLVAVVSVIESHWRLWIDEQELTTDPRRSAFRVYSRRSPRWFGDRRITGTSRTEPDTTSTERPKPAGHVRQQAANSGRGKVEGRTAARPMASQSSRLSEWQQYLVSGHFPPEGMNGSSGSLCAGESSQKKTFNMWATKVGGSHSYVVTTEFLYRQRQSLNRQRVVQEALRRR